MVLLMVDRHCFRLNVRHLTFVVYFSNRLYSLILLIKDLDTVLDETSRTDTFH